MRRRTLPGGLTAVELQQTGLESSARVPGLAITAPTHFFVRECLVWKMAGK
jgi:hypothetical protein